jgi:NTE family protein
MDQTRLLDHIRTNIGTGSFREAFEHSGRALNISVSPTRTRQKPRLLNELTAPDVTIDSAVLASCAVPGIYPSVTLQARDRSDSTKDKEIPYMPTEKWIDGSVHGDLPHLRMARLHNINKTIVSQANPHVLPFITQHAERGLSASLRQAASSLVHAHVAALLDLTRNTWSSPMVRPLIELAHSMATQSYLGDINIQFPFRPTLYRKVLSNPSVKDLAMYIRIGEQATWPMIAMIEDQTLISRTFRECIGRLKHRGGSERQRTA